MYFRSQTRYSLSIIHDSFNTYTLQRCAKTIIAFLVEKYICQYSKHNISGTMLFFTLNISYPSVLIYTGMMSANFRIEEKGDDWYKLIDILTYNIKGEKFWKKNLSCIFWRLFWYLDDSDVKILQLHFRHHFLVFVKVNCLVL